MRIVVIGGGIGGLGIALFLAPSGHDVTLVEQDPMDHPADPDEAWSRWPRRGVAQFRNIHLFNARGRNLLLERAPHVVEALLAAGAGELHLGGAGDDELVRLLCRRTTYEWVLRGAVLDDGRARVLGGRRVAALLGDERRVTGVRLDDETEIPADLVVDASGRRPALPALLAGLGARPPVQERESSGTVSYTRWYRLRDEEAARITQADLGYAAAVVAPADDRMFCVVLAGQDGYRPIRAARHEAAYDAATAAVPRIAAWIDPERSTVESPVEVMADRGNRITRLVQDGSPVAAGVVALGDAAMCTNPSYGRGVGLALVHAAVLGDVLEEVADAGDAPHDAALAFDDVTQRELEPWFHAAVGADRVRQEIARRILAGEPWEAIGAPGDDPAVRFARGAPHAVEHDPVVARAFHRAFQLLDPPSSFWGNQDIAARIDDVWHAFDGAPPPRPGPGHEAMARLLASATP
jgi:2-polyprenyl-6-methoxyphenol hydroxylase-like FAD-dependent oxidoreductase